MIIGSRGSALALAQTEYVRSLLQEKGIQTTLRIVKTSGDMFADRPLHEVGTGIFVREIDELMLEGEIDVAVHSMKDVPTERSHQLVLSAVLRRDSPYDVLVSNFKFEELPEGAVIGTSSLRRRAQLLRLRSDLNIVGMRGNVDTRLRKLRRGDYDGIVLAEAGLRRMGIDVDAERLPIVPSAGQGAIAVITRKDVDDRLKQFNHEPSRREIEVERTILKILGGGCIVPIGVLARAHDDTIIVKAEILSPDGWRCISMERSFHVSNYKSAAVEMGTELKRKGGAELVEEAIKSIKG
ncbi:MAG: hydroxymethylbilane synthase [Methanocellales archaeon]|nr:hydroxymethylbilane synthase [Methanocellales archaeon]